MWITDIIYIGADFKNIKKYFLTQNVYNPLPGSEKRHIMSFFTWNYKIGIKFNYISLMILNIYSLQLQAIFIISSELNVYSL